jgi:flagellar hook-basal body complex protein FliE
MKVSSNLPSISQFDLGQIERSLRANRESSGDAGQTKSAGTDFSSMLKDSLKTVNESLVESEKMATDLATGKSSNIHETMLAATKAELGFNMMVQLRNKAIDAYQEVLRMQV